MPDNTDDIFTLCDANPPIWQDGIPPYCEFRALQAVSVLRTYRQARIHGRSFVYSSGASFLNGYAVNDGTGSAKIDCSTYVHLGLRGVRYENSPYAEDPPIVGQVDPADYPTDTDYAWADNGIFASATLANAICTSPSNRLMARHAAEIAKYYWAAGRVFPDTPANRLLLRPGDLVFCRKESRDGFMRISHVGMVSEDVTKFYNVTDIDNLVVVLTNFSARSDYYFFARPDYTKPRGAYPFPEENYLEAPWALRQQESVDNVIAIPNVQTGTIWTGTQGTNEAEGNRVITLAKAGTPFYLPAGTYRLTGAPTYQDARSDLSHKYWGLRVYHDDYETNNIQCTMYGYDPVNHVVTSVTGMSERVWDRGYGAEFTLTQGSWLYASIYISRYPYGDTTKYHNTDSTVDIWRPRIVRLS